MPAEVRNVSKQTIMQYYFRITEDEVRDPLASNVALRHAAKYADPVEVLLNCPQVVGAALRLRSKRVPRSADPCDAYVDKLACAVIKRVAAAFDLDFPKGLPLTSLLKLPDWNDDWKKTASIVFSFGKD